MNETDYLDHILFCSINIVAPKGPLGSCLAMSGMPMFSNVVFGGYDGVFPLKPVVLSALHYDRLLKYLSHQKTDFGKKTVFV